MKPIGGNKRVARPAATDSNYDRIYQMVRRIPAGRVSTYGEIAEFAGLPRQARLVGYALFALPEHTTVPWHRVVNASGGISVRSTHPQAGLRQRRLLEAEGVAFDANGRIALQRWRWNGPATTPRTKRKRLPARRKN